MSIAADARTQTIILADSQPLFGAGTLPPFAALRAFEAVFRTGGIRKAAKALDLNHAVVSRHLKLLEEWLGAPLLVRQGNRLSLTEEGAHFHARVSAAFAELALATREFVGGRQDGYLRIFCIPGLSIQWLSAQIADFERSHPDIRIELKPTDRPANLHIHEADADIRYYPDSEARNTRGGLKFFELARPDVMAVASPAFLASNKPLGTAEDLLRAPLLHEEDDSEWRGWLALNGIETADPLPGMLCWHAHLAIAGARQGRGIALASRFLVAEDLERGDLVALQVPGSKPVPLGAYMLVSREDRWSLPALATLRRFLRMRANPPSGAQQTPQ